MKFIFIIPYILVSLSSVAQDTLPQIEEIAETYYENLYTRFNAEGREFNIQFIDQNGYPPSPDSFFNMFYRTERKRIITELIDSKTCLDDVKLNIYTNISIWEHKKQGGIPDSMIIQLLDQLFEVDKEEGINYCIQNWAFWKPHIKDYKGNNQSPYIRNYPYLTYLFDNIPISDLCVIFLTNPILSRSNYLPLNDLVIKELNIRLSHVKYKKMLSFIDLSLSLDQLKNTNKNFYNNFKKLRK